MEETHLGAVIEYVQKVVIEAGEILKRHFTSHDFSIEEKNDVDIVTGADKEVERFLGDSLLRKYPDTTFLGEETAPEDYEGLRSARSLWIVDPLDGTINFARGNPHFAVSVALVVNAKPVLGVVHVPMLAETYSAQADTAGAYRNGKRIMVSEIGDLSKAVLESDSAAGKRGEMLELLEALSSLGRIQVMGSAVTAMAYVASGTVDAYAHRRLKPWDVAAAGLLIERAGGKVTTLAGHEWDVFEPSILATNDILHESILSLISGKGIKSCA